MTGWLLARSSEHLPESGQGLIIQANIRARAKGAEKASCGEIVVQKGVLESLFSSLPPQVLLLKRLKTLELMKTFLLSAVAFWMTVSPHDTVSAPLVRPQTETKNSKKKERQER